MAVADAQKRYDKFETSVPKGRKAVLLAHAAERGESLNGFVNRAIDEAFERDGGVIHMPGVGGADVCRKQMEAMERFLEAIDNIDEPIPIFERVNFEERVFFEPEEEL